MSMFPHFMRIPASTEEKGNTRRHLVLQWLDTNGLSCRQSRYVKSEGLMVLDVVGYMRNPRLCLNTKTNTVINMWAGELNNNAIMAIDVFRNADKVSDFKRQYFKMRHHTYTGKFTTDTRWKQKIQCLQKKTHQEWQRLFEKVGQRLISVVIDVRNKKITIEVQGMWELNYSLVLSQDTEEIQFGLSASNELKVFLFVSYIGSKRERQQQPVMEEDIPFIVDSTKDATTFFEELSKASECPPPPPPPPPLSSSFSSFIPPHESLFTLKELEIKGQRYAAIALPQEPHTKKPRQELPAIPAGSLPNITMHPQRRFMR